MRRLFRLPGLWILGVTLAGVFLIQGCADRQPVSSRPEANVAAEPTPDSTTAPAESKTPVQDPSIAENVQRLVSSTLSVRSLGNVVFAGRSCWSSDGNSVLCLVDSGIDWYQELAFVDLSSGSVTKVETDVPDISGAFLSPDGESILFIAGDNDSSGLHLVSSNGGNSQKVASLGDRWWTVGQSWSPDSERVIVAFEDQIGYEVALPASLYTVDTSGRRRLVESPFDINIRPQWAADGKSVGFLSGEMEDQKDYDGYRNMHLNRLEVSDRGVVLSSEEVPSDTIRRFVHVLWSPSVDRVAYLSDWTSEHIGLLWIKVIGEDNPISVTSGYNGAAGLCWSPDGEWLAFVGLVETVGVFVVAKDGTGLKRLLDWPEDAPMYLFDMSWSPDGSRLLLSGQAFDGPERATYVIEVAEPEGE